MGEAKDALRWLGSPVTAGALAVLALNDHLLKQAWPGPVTGKLSDVAGLVFFPLLVRAITRLPIGACVAITGLGFAAVKLWAPATAACAQVLGWLQLGSEPVVLVRDPTDLLALPALAVAVWIARNGERARGVESR